MAATQNQDLESKIQHEVGHHDVYDEKAVVSDFKADAIEAENAEHNMTVLQAVRAYPMATFWAFVMSCTIVSFHHTITPQCCMSNMSRLWSPTTSS